MSKTETYRCDHCEQLIRGDLDRYVMTISPTAHPSVAASPPRRWDLCSRCASRISRHERG